MFKTTEDVVFIEVPHNGCLDVADDVLAKKLREYAEKIDLAQQNHLVLVTGDQDFISAEKALAELQVKITLLHDVRARDELLASATTSFNFREFIMRKGLDVPKTFDLSTRTRIFKRYRRPSYYVPPSSSIQVVSRTVQSVTSHNLTSSARCTKQEKA